MKNTKTASLDELRRMKTRGELTATRDDAPETELPDDFWDDAEIVDRTKTKSVHLRVDEDVYAFFKAQGRGHLTRMQSVLRTYVDAQRRKPTS